MDGEQRLGGRRPGVRRGRKTDAARRIGRTGKNGDYNRFDPAVHMVSVFSIGLGKEKNYQNVEKFEKWRKISVLKHFNFLFRKTCELDPYRVRRANLVLNIEISPTRQIRPPYPPHATPDRHRHFTACRPNCSTKKQEGKKSIQNGSESAFHAAALTWVARHPLPQQHQLQLIRRRHG